MHHKPRRSNGFRRAVSLMETQIRRASETRGFAHVQILTHWADIVGPDLAKNCKPIDVKYQKSGLGATLSVLTTGAFAPMIEMQKDIIRSRVNAVYGYNAISKVRVTQTAPTGFADGQVEFTPKPKVDDPPTPAITQESNALTQGVNDANLKRALEGLAKNVLSKHK